MYRLILKHHRLLIKGIQIKKKKKGKIKSKNVTSYIQYLLNCNARIYLTFNKSICIVDLNQ